METSNTVRKIDQIIKRVAVHPEYSVVVAGEVRSALRGDAIKHSIQLEHEAEGLSKKKRESAICTDFRNLNTGWDYLANNGISLPTLASLGGIVSKGSRDTSFRHEDVVIGEVDPTPKEKVYHEMDGLVWFYDNVDIHPVTKGINMHIETARIHPWIDGNGRSARLLQTFSNEANGLPPAIIYASDFELYKQIIRGALKDRVERTSSYDNPSEREKIFNSFLESRILESAEHLEQELLKRRHYTGKITGVKDKPLAMTVMRKIQGLGRRQGSQGVRAHVENGRRKKGTYSLKVSGDVCLDDIKTVLNGARSDYGIKYQIEPLRGCFEGKSKF